RSHVCSLLVCVVVCFFFSSRRRHTRFSRDWSSDVCSSDLGEKLGLFVTIESSFMKRYATLTQSIIFRMFDFTRCPLGWGSWNPRSEERRVGKSVDHGCRRMMRKKT